MKKTRSGHSVTSSNSAGAAVNAFEIFTGSGILKFLYATNTDASSARYIQVFDTDEEPSDSDIPEVSVPCSTFGFIKWTEELQISKGCWVCCSSSAATLTKESDMIAFAKFA